jgi:hypothetical protein
MKKDIPESKISSKSPSDVDAEKSVAVGAAVFLPKHHDIPSLKEASLKCEGCELYKYANGTVFGEGPAKARVIFVGEQPGDSEDKQGRLFVGPAGRLLTEF